MRQIIFLCFILIIRVLGIAQVQLYAQIQKGNYSGWQTNPFEYKAFIENKGQFNEEVERKNSDIKFAFTGEGVSIYFSPRGLTWRHDEYEKGKENEREESDRDKESVKVTTEFIGMEWAGANPDVEIIPLDPVPYYFTYPDIKASAYKKVLYKNIYPGIDVEYTFPENKSGIKYSLIVHPGADPSVIKMKYTDVAGLEKDKEGNVQIKTLFGNIVDHAPQTFYSDNRQAIPSMFIVKNNVVSFSLSLPISNSGDRTMIIDPWTTNPNFAGFNSAYDIDYDYAGNVYVYGGHYSSPNYFQEIKLNSAGAIQWVYTTTPFNYAGYYGDFCVDANSGSSYLGEGLNIPPSPNPGARMLKLNASGTQIALYPGNSKLKEIWRLAYNSCTKKGVVGGSGWNAGYEAAVLDTTLATLNPLNMLPSGLQDLDLLAIDNSNNCFMGFATMGSSVNNQLLKCPVGTLLPVAYNVKTNFQMTEIQTVKYVNNTTGPNGMNGIAVNGTNLYTYNSSKVKRYNKNTGVVIDSVILTPPAYCCFPNFYLSVSWGGITVDECGNIFVGSHDTIFQLNAAYNKVAFIKTLGDVYDLKLGPGNLLYACGKGFVSAFPSGVTCNAINASVNTNGVCAASSASVTVTGGVGSYTYSWVPSGQTTQIVTGLPAGTYTVTVKDNSCPPEMQTVTFTISPGAFVPGVSSTPASCLASNGTATVTPNGGTAPYTYQWNPSGGTNAIATGLIAGNYSVTVTDATGCSGTSTVAITSSGGPAVTLGPQANILCNGLGTGSVSVNASGGTPPFSYAWFPSGGSTSIASGLVAGTYTAIVTDANGCSSVQVVNILQPTAITATVSSTGAACGSNNGTAMVVASGGTGTFTYNWSAGQTTTTATGLGAGIYTVTVTDANGCTNVQTISINQPSTIASTATSTPTPCGTNNGTATVAGSGGVIPYSYSWSPAGQTTATATGLSAGSYTATVTDAAGCSSIVTVSVTTTGGITAIVSANVTIVSGNTVSLSASGDGSYLWSNGSVDSVISVSPVVTTVYCVTVSKSSCTDTACVTVYIEPVDCTPYENENLFVLPSAFSPNEDGQNDKWRLLYPSPLLNCIVEFEVNVYNRWGENVFTSTNLAFAWDGTYDGKMENTTVFAYYMKAKTISGKEIFKKGNISLLK